MNVSSQVFFPSTEPEENLPYSLQDRWITQGDKYKEDNHVSFAPFGFFVKSILSQAKIRNDPSFCFSANCLSSVLRTEKPHRLISVRKTNVSTTPSDPVSSHTIVKKAEDPELFCPIHKKPHPLTKCRTFRKKHIVERKSFLKAKGICFRCLCVSGSSC